jgi:hypothetical protein
MVVDWHVGRFENMASPALAHARASALRVHERMKSLREKNKAVIRETVGAGIATATAIGLGYFRQSSPDAYHAGLLGFPPSLVLGILGTGASMLGLGGSESAGYLGNVGTGAMAAWGYEMGMSLADKNTQQTTP